jgi:hypothetical protein
MPKVKHLARVCGIGMEPTSTGWNGGCSSACDSSGSGNSPACWRHRARDARHSDGTLYGRNIRSLSYQVHEDACVCARAHVSLAVSVLLNLSLEVDADLATLWLCACLNAAYVGGVDSSIVDACMS